MTIEQYIKNLSSPKGRVDVVLDTDAFNEADDQFAIAYILTYPQRLNVKAIYAAPFFNINSTSPKDGMEKSYDEIINILNLADRQDIIPNVFKGAEDFLPDMETPQISAAAQDLAKRAMEYSPENPLYVVGIGASTNIASALLINPDIAENIVIVWLGGNDHDYPDTKEFNMIKDIHAAKILFDSKAPFVQIPAYNTVITFTVSNFEVEYLLRGKNKLCNYLAELYFTDHNIFKKETRLSKPIARIICDVCAIAWLLNDEDRFLKSYLTTKPIVQDNGYYSFDKRRQMMSYVYNINRNAIVCDMFERITDDKYFKI